MQPLLHHVNHSVALIDPPNHISTPTPLKQAPALLLFLPGVLPIPCDAPRAKPCGKVCAMPGNCLLMSKWHGSTLCGALLQGCASPIVATQGCTRLINHCCCAGHPTGRLRAAAPGASKMEYRVNYEMISVQSGSQGTPRGKV